MTVCTEAEALAALRMMARIRGRGSVMQAVIMPRYPMLGSRDDAGLVLTGARPMWWIRETGILSEHPRVPSRPDDMLSCTGPDL